MLKTFVQIFEKSVSEELMIQKCEFLNQNFDQSHWFVTSW